MTTNNSPIHVAVRMTFLRDEPQNLPASNLVVVISALAALLSIVLLKFDTPIFGRVELAVLQITVYGIIVAAVLWLSKRLVRWRQTISAIYGTDCVLGCLSYFPILLISDSSQEAQPYFLLLMVGAFFGIWRWAITTLIFKEALNISKFKAVFLALVVNTAASLIVLQLFGGFAKQTAELIQ